MPQQRPEDCRAFQLLVCLQREDEVAKVEERRAAELATKAAFAAKQEDIRRMVNDNAANQEAMQEADARLQAGL